MKVKAAIFDLDMTLVNSSAAASLRKAMKWTQVYKKIPSFDLYPGVPELLQQLTNNRIRQCIVTSASEEYCKRVLGHFRVQPEISICYHHTKRHKPHPEPIQLALDKLDLSPSEAFSIGDEPHDITASRSAGVPAFAALWGSQDRIQLLKLADQVFSSPGELADYLTDSFRQRVLESPARDRILYFSGTSLARGGNLASVSCLGYRFSDNDGDDWTAYVNQFKANKLAANKKCVSVIIRTLHDIGLPEGPILVVPILGSQDKETIDRKPISRMARAIGGLGGYQYCPRLLYKKERYRRLHTIQGADNRDAEVEGKYCSRRFGQLDLNKPSAVLLVDDIVTRGTTMNDAARAIKESNGHVIVNGIALAKAERSFQSGTQLENNCINAYLQGIENEEVISREGQVKGDVVIK